MTKLRVLHIIPDFGPGGAERMAVHLMRHMDRSRFEVAAISLYGPAGTDIEEMLKESGIPIWYLDKKVGFDPRMYFKIDHVIKSFAPHVVHTHRSVLRYVLPSLYSRSIRATVHTVHTVAENEVDWIGKWIHRLAFRCGVVPIAIAQKVAASLTHVYRLNGFPIIPNGIPVEEYCHPKISREAWREQEGFQPENVLLVCIARLSSPKNHELLIRAFAQGPALDSNTHLLLVGEGRLKPSLQKLSDEIGLSRRVHFLGLRTDIPEILGSTDIFVLSSDWEGNPLSVMEAMSGGKPVISTAVGGVPELVEDEVTGLLVPQGNIEAMTKCLSYLVLNPELCKSMGELAAKLAKERFDVKVMTKAYEALYEKILTKV